MKNTFFDEILVIQLPNHCYKILYMLKQELPFDIPALSDDNIRAQIGENLAYEMGWLLASCKLRGLIITEVELVLPPYSEYLNFEKVFTEIHEEKNIRFTLLIGSSVSIPGNDLQANMAFIDEQIDKIRQTNPGLN